MILVAGGTGRLGTAVVRRLVDRGARVRVLTRVPERAGHLPGKVEIVAGDVRAVASLTEAVSGCALVVSLVQGFAGPGRGSPASVDRDGNINLIDAAKAADADVVLMSGVGAAADSPMELFRMKYAAEQYLRRSGVRATIVQATAFRELWVELLTQTVGRSGRPLVFGRGNNPINFVAVEDVATAVERVITDHSTRGTIIRIGGPDNLTLNQLAGIVQADAGRTASPRHIPPAARRVVGHNVGRLKPEIGRQARAALVMDYLDLTFDASQASNSPGAHTGATSRLGD